MISYIAPSLDLAMREHSSDPREQFIWLAERYADQRWTEDSDLSHELLADEGMSQGAEFMIESIVEFAAEFGCTTNGAWEIYLDSWTSIPWCSEDQRLEWYA